MEGRFRRPTIVVLLVFFDLIAGLLAVPAVMVVQALAPFLVLLPGTAAVFGGLCWGAALALWRMTRRGRTLQIIVASLGLILAPPLSTAIFLPILLLMLRPGARILFSGRSPDELTDAEITHVARFNRRAEWVAFGMLVPAALLWVGASVLVSVLEVASNRLHEAIAANETAALRDVRTLLSAEQAYATVNHGFYGPPDCLRAPGRCLRDRAGVASFLSTAVEGQSSGYVRRFHGGPTADPEEAGQGGFSSSSIRSFAYVAVPVEAGTTGRRAFCVDATGLIRFTIDKGEPVPVDGICPRAMLFLP